MDYCEMYFDLLNIERRANANQGAFLPVREHVEFLRALRELREYCWEAMAWLEGAES